MLKQRFTSLLAPHTKVTEEQLATEEGILALGQNLRAINRRRFLTTMAAASAVATAAGTLGTRSAEAQSTAPSVADVLNFALNLEFLEAEFYSYGYNGMSLAQNVATSSVTGATGPIPATIPAITTSNVLHPPSVTLTGNQQAVCLALLLDEAHHIATLQTAIANMTDTAITEPTIDFSAGGTMPAITTNTAFFAAARQFTTLGNSAYMGAGADLISNTAVLQVAAQILGAEAQHQGVVNYLCATLGITPTQDTMIDAQDVPPNGYSALFTITSVTSYTGNPAPNNGPAIGIARTPQQVLGVAYGVSKPTTTTPTAGVVKGGFFPNGVNGNIKST